MAAGVKHYFKNGKEHKGATHKDAKGKVMSGKTHTASSKSSSVDMPLDSGQKITILTCKRKLLML
jgi:hypothetical protein